MHDTLLTVCARPRLSSSSKNLMKQTKWKPWLPAKWTISADPLLMPDPAGPGGVGVVDGLTTVGGLRPMR